MGNSTSQKSGQEDQNPDKNDTRQFHILSESERENYKGLVYIVTNEKPLRIRDDHWLDFRTANSFFDNLVDEYQVVIEHGVTHS